MKTTRSDLGYLHRCAIFLTSALAMPTLACAASTGSGAKIIRVDETSAQEYCINGKTDEIFVHLRSFVAGKDRNIFKEDASIGMVIDTTVSGDVRRQPEKISFPIAFQATVRNYREGLVSIPIEKGILSGFALSDGDARYSEVDLSFRFITVEEDTTIGRAIKSVASVTEDFSLPTELFGASFQMYASVASSLIDNVFTNNRNSTDPLASIVLAFDPDGSCDNLLFEKTGTKAVVMGAEGREQDGIVDIDQINSYCFQTELRPSFEVWFWKRAGGVCPDRPADARQLRNPHFGFYVTARSIDPEDPSRGDREAGMLDLCEAHGLTDPQLCGGISPGI
ncbi:MAG: hypothetical protein ACREQ1_00470 [Woeseiaceae bacterium]